MPRALDNQRNFGNDAYVADDLVVGGDLTTTGDLTTNQLILENGGFITVDPADDNTIIAHPQDLYTSVVRALTAGGYDYVVDFGYLSKCIFYYPVQVNNDLQINDTFSFGSLGNDSILKTLKVGANIKVQDGTTDIVGFSTSGVTFSTGLKFGSDNSRDIGETGTRAKAIYCYNLSATSGITSAGVVSITNATVGASGGTGALTVSGGIYAGDSSYFNGQVTAASFVYIGSVVLPDTTVTSRSIGSNSRSFLNTYTSRLFLNNSSVTTNTPDASGQFLRLVGTGWKDTTTATNTTASNSFKACSLASVQLSATNGTTANPVTTPAAYTLYIDGAPIGTTGSLVNTIALRNSTLTSGGSYSLYVASGPSWFGGPVNINNATNNWGLNNNSSTNNLEFLYNGTSKGYLDSTFDASQIDFTGQHLSIPAFKPLDSHIGLIVASNGNICNLDGAAAPAISEALPEVILAAELCSPSVYGVLAAIEPAGSERLYSLGSFTTISEVSDAVPRVSVNSVGEGSCYVIDFNDVGVLSNGTYITSSPIPGYGVAQTDDLLHNYTVAKLTAPINFANVTTPRARSRITGYDPSGAPIREPVVDISGEPVIDSAACVYRYISAAGSIVTASEYSDYRTSRIGSPVYLAVLAAVTYHCG